MNPSLSWLVVCVLAGFAAASTRAKEPPKATSASRKPPTIPKPRSADATPEPKPVAEVTPPAFDEKKASVEITESKPERAPAATLDPGELADFDALPPRTQLLISAALDLTKLNLTYKYGSADPAGGGMDCSGTIFHLLQSQGFTDVPRDSSGQYSWVRKTGPFFAVVSRRVDSFEFADLKPGDLMFWTGTYAVQRDPPISHVMLYLGTEKKTKKRVMFGGSDGRSYNGIQRWGVSVFDFKMPRTDGSGSENGRATVFVGYGRIPGLREPDVVEPVPPAGAEVTPAPKPKAKKKPSGDSCRRRSRVAHAWR